MSEQSWRASNGSVFDASGCIAVCDTDNADAATYAKRAVLMAAAPEMARALKSVARLLYDQAARDGGDVREAFQIARAALSKAEAA